MVKPSGRGGMGIWAVVIVRRREERERRRGRAGMVAQMVRGDEVWERVVVVCSVWEG